MGTEAMRLAIALLHYPVLNRAGETVTTAVTNLDVHDLARSALTYGVERFYVVTPVAEQRRLVNELLDHWCRGFGARYNPDRRRALELVEPVATLDEALGDYAGRTGRAVTPLLTGAGRRDGRPLRDLRRELQRRPHMLLFGTGSGLAPELFERGWPVVEPIEGTTDYNHLSVRAASAILLDRLVAGCRNDSQDIQRNDKASA
ncbi:RNA methyltransferase [Geothermobacter ehrlichii]|nr:RNA methyltransferase [Geothermobacter ehrlichii]